MENKIAVLSIIVSDTDSVETINAVLHDFKDYILGRFGLPYKQKGVNIISVVLDAPQELLNGLSGKLGMIKGVKAKLLLTK